MVTYFIAIPFVGGGTGGDAYRANDMPIGPAAQAAYILNGLACFGASGVIDVPWSVSTITPLLNSMRVVASYGGTTIVQLDMDDDYAQRHETALGERWLFAPSLDDLIDRATTKRDALVAAGAVLGDGWGQTDPTGDAVRAINASGIDQTMLDFYTAVLDPSVPTPHRPPDFVRTTLGAEWVNFAQVRRFDHDLAFGTPEQVCDACYALIVAVEVLAALQ